LPLDKYTWLGNLRVVQDRMTMKFNA